MFDAERVLAPAAAVHLLFVLTLLLSLQTHASVKVTIALPLLLSLAKSDSLQAPVT